MATNSALIIIDAFVEVINCLTHTVNDKAGVLAFPQGVVVVPESHLDRWAGTLDGSENQWACLVVGSSGTVEADDVTPIDRAEVEKINYSWCVATAGSPDRKLNWRIAIEENLDLFNSGLNAIKAEALVLSDAGTISDTPEGSYLQFGDDVDRPDSLNDEYLFAGRGFTIGIQYGTGRLR